MRKPKAKARMFIYIWRHNHGEDVGVFRYVPTRDLAIPSKASVILAFDLAFEPGENFEIIPIDEIKTVK